MRRVVQFRCENSTLFGTIDEARGSTGVLIVSGGNEVRCGAHRGMALLAQRLATADVPVFRFDRRGVGDSEGENSGYATSGPDMVAALAAFRREQPHLVRVIGFGNCDAATALLLLEHDCDALVLANPWLGDDAAPPPPAALRRYYLRRLGDAGTWKGLWSVFSILPTLLGKAGQQPLGDRVIAALGSRPTHLVLATGDRTAQVFAGSVRPPAGIRTLRIDTASHSFAGQDDALRDALIAAVRDVSEFPEP